MKPLFALGVGSALLLLGAGGCANIVGIGDLPRSDGGSSEPPPGGDAGSNPLAAFLGSWTYTGTAGGSCGLNGAGQFDVTQSGPSSIVIVLPACNLPATVRGAVATLDQGDTCTVYSSANPDTYLETVQGEFTVVATNQGRFVISGTITDENTGASCTYSEDANALK